MNTFKSILQKLIQKRNMTKTTTTTTTTQKKKSFIFILFQFIAVSVYAIIASHNNYHYKNLIQL
jgi:hypothetical protein